MRIDFSELVACRTDSDLDQKIDEIFGRMRPDDPPVLSDCLINLSKGGHPIMVALGEKYEDDRDLPPEQRLRWHIQVLRDKWGNKPRLGDKVKIKRQRSLSQKVGSERLPIPGNELSMARADGTYDEKFTTTYELPVDNKGCLTCYFQDAVHLLNTHGIHRVTKAPLMRAIKPEVINMVTGEIVKNVRELSRDPQKTPNGSELHIWNYRYQEIDRGMYEKLPKIEKSNEPKRGVAQ